jgi:hypothetical protein
VIPAPPAPDYQDTASDVAQSQLTNNPLLTKQQYDLTAQYSPLYKALTEQLYPILPDFQRQVGQQLLSPTGLAPEQQAAQDAIRQRAFQQSEKGIRESANLGGTLFGGQRQLREDRSRNELAQGFATQDIGLQDQRRQQAVQQLQTLLQLTFPQVQLSNIGGNPDNLYNALVQNQGNFGILPGTQGSPSPGWGLGGALGGAGIVGGAVLL